MRRWAVRVAAALFGAFAITLAAATTAAKDQTATHQAPEAAGFLAGSYAAMWATYNRCARVFPDRAEALVAIRDKIDAANRGIAKLAKEKWLAGIELHDGKAKRLEVQEQFDQLILKNFQQESRNHTQAELEANCLGLLSADPSKFFFTNEYPSKVSLMLDYRVGYPWSPPPCEYRVTFPHEPQLSTVTVDDVSTSKAETREEFGLPYIGAICLTITVPRTDVVDQLKRAGKRQMFDMGVRNLRWIQEFSPIGERLTALGETQRSGITVTIEKALWIGDSTLLEITLTDATEDYPSVETMQFKEWVEKK